MPASCPSNKVNTKPSLFQVGIQWGLVSHAASRAVSALAGRATVATDQAKRFFGPAPNTDKTAKRDLLRLCEREILIAEIRHLQRQHRATCSARAKLRRLTAELAGA